MEFNKKQVLLFLKNLYSKEKLSAQVSQEIFLLFISAKYFHRAYLEPLMVMAMPS